MRHVLTLLTMAAFWCCPVSLGFAEDVKASKSPDNKNVETNADTSANADLRAKIHRTTADLIEARLAEEPDQAKIDKLTKKLQQLRGNLQPRPSNPAGPQAAGWASPWGGPGMGYGRGAAWGGPGKGQGAGRAAGWASPWGGPGMGYGRGAAWGGPGKGQGAGRAAGFGPGAGRGWGGGPGGGAGRGFGPGAGMGRAPGGPAFVDRDNDGTCDNYELRHGMHK